MKVTALFRVLTGSFARTSYGSLWKLLINAFHLLSSTGILLDELADYRGRRKREQLQRKYPDGLKGRVGPIYLTRGKRIGRIFTNYREKCLVPKSEVLRKRPDVYEDAFFTKKQILEVINTGLYASRCPEHTGER